MSSFSLSVQIPGEWGRHVRTIIITVVIVVAVAYGVDPAALPFPRL